MGTCGTKLRKRNPDAKRAGVPMPQCYVPFPTTVEDFESFSDASILKSFTPLIARAKRDIANKVAPPDQMGGPYQIEVRVPSFATKDLSIYDSAQEMLEVIEAFKQSYDVSRFSVCSTRKTSNLTSKVLCVLLPRLF